MAHLHLITPINNAFTSLLVLVHQDVRLSRGVYMSAKFWARTNPEEVSVVAIDGSDQSSYGIPYFTQSDKGTVRGWKLRLKLVGALVSGRLMHFFTIANNWETGESKGCYGRAERAFRWLISRSPLPAPNDHGGFHTFPLSVEAWPPISRVLTFYRGLQIKLN